MTGRFAMLALSAYFIWAIGQYVADVFALAGAL